MTIIGFIFMHSKHRQDQGLSSSAECKKKNQVKKSQNLNHGHFYAFTWQDSWEGEVKCSEKGRTRCSKTLSMGGIQPSTTANDSANLYHSTKWAIGHHKNGISVCLDWDTVGLWAKLSQKSSWKIDRNHLWSPKYYSYTVRLSSWVPMQSVNTAAI